MTFKYEESVPITDHNDYRIDYSGNIKRNDGYIPKRSSTTGVHKQYLNTYLHGKRYAIHRLVAEHFIPNPDDKEWVDHIDRDTHNNHMDNLRWSTRAENLYNRPRQEGSTRKYDLPKNIWIRPEFPNLFNVKVQVNNIQIHVAMNLTDLEEAKRIARDARKLYHKEYANE